MEINNSYLINEVKRSLEEKCKKNPRFSLRSYAKSLGVSPATLSGILSGKRALSLKMIERFGLALGLGTDVIIDHQRDYLSSKAELLTSESFKNLLQDEFASISDWYNLAILEVMKLKVFKPDYQWVAKQLDVNVNNIRLAVERLQRLGILEIKNGKWIDRTEGYTTHLEAGTTSQARKIYQKQLLEKSMEKLIQDDLTLRDHTSMTMAIDIQDMQKAKEEITKFRRRLSRILEKKSAPTHVYQLQVSFFRLTEK